MEDQTPKPVQPQPLAPAASTPTVPSPTQEVHTMETKKTPKEMLSSLLPKSSFPIKKVIIIAVVILIVLILLLVGVSILSRLMKPAPVAIPSPTPEATFIPATPTPSRYATDSAVLDIEKNIETLDKELSEVDLDEVNLKPRALKWEVTFK